MLWKGEEGEEKLDDEVVVCGGWVVFSLIGDDRGDGVRLGPLSTVLLPDPVPEKEVEIFISWCFYQSQFFSKYVY